MRRHSGRETPPPLDRAGSSSAVCCRAQTTWGNRLPLVQGHGLVPGAGHARIALPMPKNARFPARWTVHAARAPRRRSSANDYRASASCSLVGPITFTPRFWHRGAGARSAPVGARRRAARTPRRWQACDGRAPIPPSWTSRPTSRICAMPRPSWMVAMSNPRMSRAAGTRRGFGGGLAAAKRSRRRQAGAADLAVDHQPTPGSSGRPAALPRPLGNSGAG